MGSKRKTAANRKNAQSSTGPKDTTNTRYNAVKHGITSQQVIVPAVDGPDATERFNAILEGLRQELNPQGILQSSLVDEIALVLQQRRRAVAYESASPSVYVPPPPRDQRLDAPRLYIELAEPGP